jgi:streptogramin lyase
LRNASSRVFFLNTDGAIVRSFTMPQLGSAIHTIAADEANNRVLILHTVPPAGTSSIDAVRRDVYISALADDGTLTNYLITPSGSMIGWYYSLVVGPDNNIWYAEYDYHRIGRLNPSTGQVTYFQLATRTFPTEIVVGPDSNLWFLEWGGTGIGKLARMTTAGVLTEFAIPGLVAGCGPRGLSADEFSLWDSSWVLQ